MRHMSRRESGERPWPPRRRTAAQRFVDAWVGLWGRTPIRVLQRLGLMRSRSRPERIGFGPPDDGGAAGSGVPARLPKIPPRFSPGNAATIPRDEVFTDAAGRPLPP
jgi:hypothetical protein